MLVAESCALKAPGWHPPDARKRHREIHGRGGVSKQGAGNVGRESKNLFVMSPSAISLISSSVLIPPINLAGCEAWRPRLTVWGW